MNIAAPLSLTPVYKDYIWGGHRFAELYGREGAPPCCAESWEISAHKDGMSVVASGPCAGMSLFELCLEHGSNIVGTKTKNPKRFPLLIKLIDARDKLSVQVHPSLADPSADPSEIKNECWYNLVCPPHSHIYAGFKAGVDKIQLQKVLEHPEIGVDSVLSELSPKQGQSLFIPAGLVHSIGAGCLVYEVQQNSSVTYRFYDWGRVDSNGNGRPLHVAKAMRSIDWSLSTSSLLKQRKVDGSHLSVCVATDYFTVFALDAVEPETVDTFGESFHALFAEHGSFTVETSGGSASITTGASLLVPACARQYRIVPATSDSRILITRL